MATVAASTLRTLEVSLTGDPEPLTLPDGIRQVLEIRAIGTDAWAFCQADGDPEYPVAADTEVVIPVSNVGQVLVTGAGTLSVVFFGNG